MKYTALALSFFSLLIILQNTSCTRGNKYVKETQMLDSIQIFIVKSDSAVKTIDSVKITGYANQVEKDNQLLGIAHVDSMSSAATAIFRSFNAVRWALLTDAGKSGPLAKELEKSQRQIKSLSHDMQHNLLNADSVSYYVAYETKRASELIETTDMTVTDVKKQVPLYTMLLPKTDSLMALLKDHKKF